MLLKLKDAFFLPTNFPRKALPALFLEALSLCSLRRQALRYDYFGHCDHNPRISRAFMSASLSLSVFMCSCFHVQVCMCACVYTHTETRVNVGCLPQSHSTLFVLVFKTGTLTGPHGLARLAGEQVLDIFSLYSFQHLRG